MSNRFKLFIQLIRPLFLLGGAFLYALGAGIADYLGVNINWDAYIFGQLWVTTLQLSTHLLNEYFNSDADAHNNNRTPFTGGSNAIGEGKINKKSVFIASLACLATLASLTVLIIAALDLSVLAWAIMLAAFLGAFFYSTPPVRLEASGFGELTTSLLVAMLLPGFAFVIQTGEFHSLLAMSTIPLVFIHLAMLICFEFPDYSIDQIYKKTLLVRIGWQNGILVHNLSLLTGYLLLAIAWRFGLPARIAIFGLLTMPVGILQIWQLRRIEAGNKPSWTALTLNGLASFSLLVYVMTFGYWFG